MLRSLASQGCLACGRVLQQPKRPLLTVKVQPRLAPAYKYSEGQRGLSASCMFVKAGAVEGAVGTPIRDAMQEKLSRELEPTRLDIVDESSQHAGHVGSRMQGNYSGETHFRVSLVSPKFEGLTTIKRHKLVYQVLSEEMAGPVHALSLKTKTPAEAGD